ncbi:MAG TPA: asparagine synthase (glutamine-hydrolyzing) [Blastocatellia bacterium]|nr:asparagine synthase (glutamine-hydrolyzing) [Blastocatellia bacterium]
MCGIAGIYSPEDGISPEALHKGIRRLNHRGPDLERQWVAPHRQVGLAHARLSIIDLTTGDQPIANEDESLRLIVNGEFYDFARIRGDLTARGHRFRSTGDSEIALHLYEERGFRCLEQLRGEFALILWDQRNELLFAARDRFGIKPLYYAAVGKALYLASEIKALFAAGVPARWDRESFYQQLFSCTHSNRTLFEGVFQVPPGHYLVATRKGIRIIRYWDLDYPVEPQPLAEAGAKDHIHEFRERLDEAIRLRLTADVAVGCFLSGGLDSSSVLGLAARHTTHPIRAFTVGFDEPSYDETHIARETAKLVGADFHPIPIHFADFAGHIRDAVWHAEMLGINPHGIARYLHSQAVHENGYKVVLSGEGSDEIMAGYSYARSDWRLTNELLQKTGPVTSSGHPMRVSRTPLAPADDKSLLEGVQGRLGFTPSWLSTLAVSRSIFHLVTREDFEAEFAGRDVYREFVDQFDIDGQLFHREPVIQSMYLWSKSILPNYILFAERLEMAHAVEVRLPFLDHHLFEFVRRLPPSLIMYGAREKHMLREAARNVLTDTVYTRPKQPFTAPPITLSTHNPLYVLTQESLRGPALASLPFFDQTRVVAFLDALPEMNESMRLALDPMLMMVLSATILQERYNPA